MTHRNDPFAQAEQNAHKWLAVVADRLDTADRQYAHRALRVWLHLVRDRLGVTAVAHLGAQLPELLRGELFESWVPSRAPEQYGVTEFLDRFADGAGIDVTRAAEVAAGVTAALRDLFSAGQLDHALAQFPRALRDLLLVPVAMVVEPVGPDDPATGADRAEDRTADRLERLEAAVGALTEAVSTLARGLEGTSLDEPVTGRAAKAASEAHSILLAGSDMR